MILEDKNMLHFLSEFAKLQLPPTDLAASFFCYRSCADIFKPV